MAYSSRSLSPSRGLLAAHPQRRGNNPSGPGTANPAWALRRRSFLGVLAAGAAAAVLPGSGCDSPTTPDGFTGPPVRIPEVQQGEDLFAYITRQRGAFDQTLYRQIIGAANDYKEGDEAIGVAADRDDRTTRTNARALLANTKLGDLDGQPLLSDQQYRLIMDTTDAAARARIAN